MKGCKILFIGCDLVGPWKYHKVVMQDWGGTWTLEHLSLFFVYKLEHLNTWSLEHLPVCEILFSITMSGGEHLSNWAFFAHFIFNTMSGGEVGHDWRRPWTLDQGLFPRRTNLQVKHHFTRVMWKPSQVPLPTCWHPQACQLGEPD